MDISEWKWKTSDGLEIYSKAWIPSGNIRGVVCLVHGVGEHIGRYQADGEALSERGYILAGFDQRGFGKSEGRRGHTPSLDAYLNDIDSFLAEVARRYPGQPRFLYGHSMGGILVLAFASLRQPSLAGVIATGPGLKSSIEAQKLKVILVKVLGNVLPTLTMTSGIELQTQLVSRDAQVVDEFTKDPLVHYKITAAWGKSMLEAIDQVYKNAPRFPLPLLLMHGTNDEIAYPRGSQLFAELAPKDKVTLKMWEGFKHELHTDPEKAATFDFMTDWMDQQLANTG
jgi:alpha-beta hydrolase superfamily lysophospholipase